MRQPLLPRPDLATAGASLSDRSLEGVGVPAANGGADGGRRALATQHVQHATLQVRQVEMGQEPTPIRGRPGLGHRRHVLHAAGHRRASVLPIRIPRPGVVDDAQCRRRFGHCDADGLPAAGAQLPEIVGRDAGGGEDGCGRFSDTEGCLVERVGPGDGDLAGLRRRHGADGHQFGEGVGPICLCHSGSLFAPGGVPETMPWLRGSGKPASFPDFQTSTCAASTPVTQLMRRL